MYKKFMSMLEKPLLYTKTTVPFWDDDHISGQMLKAHLDPDFEGASRKHEFIEKSVRWITGALPTTDYKQMIDIGCGPGIYAEKFTEEGYQVTGVDFSRRSIDYAKNEAKKKNMDISYLCQDYLKLDFIKTFDCAVMIYCDYGALSPSDRKTVMRIAFEHLRKGGRFLFDVFSIAEYERFEEGQTWEICTDGGFWSKEPYIALHGRYKYPHHATLEQTAIISENKVHNYYLWNTYFSQETLIKEAVDAGFQICGIYGDVAGDIFHKDNSTIAVLLEK